jgi:hypothetical protein
VHTVVHEHVHAAGSFGRMSFAEFKALDWPVSANGSAEWIMLEEGLVDAHTGDLLKAAFKSLRKDATVTYRGEVRAVRRMVKELGVSVEELLHLHPTARYERINALTAEHAARVGRKLPTPTLTGPQGWRLWLYMR